MNMRCIRKGIVYTITHGILKDSDILIENGKIKEIGSNLVVPKDCEIIDASGLRIYPGMIDTHTHLGLDEWGNWDEINELNEIGDPTTPQFSAVDGIYHQDKAIEEAASAGITSIIVHPGSIQLFSGQSCALKTKHSKCLKEMLISSNIGIKGGYGGTPKRFYKSIGGLPTTRMGEAYVLRQTLADACAYLEHNYVRENREWDEAEKMYALKPLLEGKIPWRVHVYKLYDIMTCIRIAKEFGIKMVLEHGGESPEIAEFLAENNIPVTVGPSGFIGSKKPETFYSVLDNIEKYIDAGTLFGFQSDHPIIHTASLPRAVGTLVKKGLNEEKALEAMTLSGAKIIGCENRIGSIDVGKDADIVIATGSVFDPMTKICEVLIDGETVYSK